LFAAYVPVLVCVEDAGHVAAALDRRFGVSAPERDHLRQVCGDPFTMVKALVGHRSETTIRSVYLEPLTCVRLASMIDGDRTDQPRTGPARTGGRCGRGDGEASVETDLHDAGGETVAIPRKGRPRHYPPSP
jgi:hypothetical protein